ncbi:MAG: penicillin-binding protein 1A [Pseudomonadota bacterium]
MLRFAFYSLLGFSFLMLAAVGAVVWYFLPQLPPVETLREVQLQTPLRVYSNEGALIAEFGEKRRVPVEIEIVPELLKQAFIAAEDDRFYFHPGVDWMAIARAALELIQSGQKKQGGSTITMQVARNFFLTRAKTYERKIKEILLAIIIERELTKDEILELYLNKIFLGHRSYGIGAAARVYYGTTIDQLNLSQIAMVAGLPQAPSKTNPVSNPKSAVKRRRYVLNRMLKLGYIDDAAFMQADRTPVSASIHGQPTQVEAHHIGEMARAEIVERFGSSAYEKGLRVTTTVRSELQEAAQRSVRAALINYDERHGYRGPAGAIDNFESIKNPEIERLLQAYRSAPGLQPGLVIAVDEGQALVHLDDARAASVTLRGVRWARQYLTADRRGPRVKAVNEVLAAGEVIYLRWYEPPVSDDEPEPPMWRLAQVPAVEGALISLSPNDGAIRALVGGFDYRGSKFNRVLQAQRQPGSNFKPFIYSAALEKGYTAAHFINDAPIVFDAPGLDSAWRPENYSGKNFGPTRLREALKKSRNLVSIRLLQQIGVNFGREYAGRFGFDVEKLPNNLSLSLGSGEVTPMSVARGYAVFSNGGFLIEPYVVEQILDPDGAALYSAEPPTVCRQCESIALDDDGEPADIETLLNFSQLPPINQAPRVIAADNAWIMTSMLQGVITGGTGRKAYRQLGRKDLAGKTGTTNEQKDAWFSGFNSEIVTTVWVGFDKVSPLGKRETGAQAALPMWIDFMRIALDGMQESVLDRPNRLVTVRIDPNTGLLAPADHPNAIFESFREGHVPERLPESIPLIPESGASIPEQLF